MDAMALFGSAGTGGMNLEAFMIQRVGAMQQAGPEPVGRAAEDVQPEPALAASSQQEHDEESRQENQERVDGARGGGRGRGGSKGRGRGRGRAKGRGRRYSLALCIFFIKFFTTLKVFVVGTVLDAVIAKVFFLESKMIKGEELPFGESASGRHAVEADSKTPPKTPPKTPQKTPPKTPPKLPTAPPTPTPFKRPSASGARFKRPAAAAEEELPVEDGQAVEENVEENVEEKKQPKSGSGANVISSISHKGGWKEQMVETKSGRKYARFLDKDGKQFFSRARAIDNGFLADKKVKK